MHHEEELSDELREATKEEIEAREKELREFLQKSKEELGLGATGRFPGEKLTSNDQGEIAFGVAVYHGKVILNFGGPVASLGLSPEEARSLALVLRQRSDEIERISIL